MQDNKKLSNSATHIKNTLQFLGLLFLTGFLLIGAVIAHRRGSPLPRWAFIGIFLAIICFAFSFIAEQHIRIIQLIKKYIAMVKNCVAKANFVVLTKAVGGGLLGGVIAGLVAHQWYAGKLPIAAYVVIITLTLAPMKGWGRIVALLVFVFVVTMTESILDFWGEFWWRLPLW